MVKHQLQLDSSGERNLERPLSRDLITGPRGMMGAFNAQANPVEDGPRERRSFFFPASEFQIYQIQLRDNASRINGILPCPCNLKRTLASG